MVFPTGVELATLTFSNPGTFLGNAAAETVIDVVATASVVWQATGEPIDNFAEQVNPGPGMPGALTVPCVDQAGFTDQSGKAFTKWAYRLTRRARLNGEPKIVTKVWQPLVGQETMDFDNLPGGVVGLPVSAEIPPVISVAGETLVVGAEALAGKLAPFLPAGETVTPENVSANLPERLSEESLTATILDQMETAMEPAAAVAVNDALAVAVTTSTSYVHGGSALVIGPAIPFGLTPGKEFIWYKTDGAGGLLDIVAGVMPEAFTDWESLTLLYPTWEAVTAAFPTWEALNSSIATV